jgi:hypothetical protein
MKFLKAAYWAILVSQVCRLIIALELTLQFAHQQIYFIGSLYGLAFPLCVLVTFFYTLIIGYSMQVFKEKKWIVWVCYTYFFYQILTSLCTAYLTSGPHSTATAIMLLFMSTFPLFVSCCGWMSAETAPIRKSMTALAWSYIITALVVLALRVIGYGTHDLRIEMLSLPLAFAPPIFILILIQKTRQYIMEEQTLKAAMDQLVTNG